MATVDDLIVVTLLTVVGMVSIVAFYRSLSAPDLLAPMRRFVGRRPWRRSVRIATEIVLGVLITLVLAITWVSAINVTLFFVLPLERVAEITLLSYVIVAASRILTFLSPSGAREFAKTIPLAFVVLLLTGEPLSAETLLGKAARLEEAIPDETALMLSVVCLELVLQLLWRVRARSPTPDPTALSVPVPRAAADIAPETIRSSPGASDPLRRTGPAEPTGETQSTPARRIPEWLIAATVAAIAALVMERASRAGSRRARIRRLD
jgi:hypothetical protein